MKADPFARSTGDRDGAGSGFWLFWFLLFMEVPISEMIVRAVILSGRDFLFPVIERSVS